MNNNLMRLRVDMVVLTTALCFIGVTGAAFAQTYHNKTIRFLMPHPTGAGMDFVSRTVAQKLIESWGQQVIVDSRPGAGGIIGLQLAAKAPPDGYTLIPSSIGPLAVNPSLFSKLPYDTLRDFDPVTLLISALNVLVVHPSVPVKSVKELIALAKSRPGQLRYGTSGYGNTDHLAGEMLKSMTGIDLVHVPYKGGGPAAIAVLSGEIEMIFAVYQNVAPQIHKLRMLAVAGAKRMTAAPQLPTIAESGVKGYAIDAWFGLVAPAGVPKDIVAKINAATVNALKSADVRQRFGDLGYEVIGDSPDQFGATIKSDIDKYVRLIKKTGIKAE